MIELAATVREEKGKKLSALRAEGKLPAVVYGAKVDAASIMVDERDFLKILRNEGETALVTLKGLSEEHEVLIQDVDFDVVKNKPLHVDFYAVERGKEIEVTIPLEFIGESKAEKAGEQLVKVLHEVEVKTTPGKIPSHIDVDISVLNGVDDKVQIKDISIPEGVTLLHDAEDIVILVQEHAEEEEEETASVDMDSIEVEKKGKEEEEGEKEG